jgi:hypothetical protein
MARIPWWLWAVVGAVMYFIAARLGESFVVFTYVGLLFLGIGIFKMLVAFIVGTKGRKADKEARELRTHQLTCPNCRYVVASTYAFCPHCGMRLR